MKNKTESYVSNDTNFCRIFELPDKYPEGFLFSGAKPVTFLLMDWFYPIPSEDIRGKKVKPWAYYAERLKTFIQGKLYARPGKTYLLITNFGKSLIIEKGAEDGSLDSSR